jgi:hypothetical protein
MLRSRPERRRLVDGVHGQWEFAMDDIVIHARAHPAAA